MFFTQFILSTSSLHFFDDLPAPPVSEVVVPDVNVIDPAVIQHTSAPEHPRHILLPCHLLNTHTGPVLLSSAHTLTYPNGSHKHTHSAPSQPYATLPYSPTQHVQQMDFTLTPKTCDIVTDKSDTDPSAIPDCFQATNTEFQPLVIQTTHDLPQPAHVPCSPSSDIEVPAPALDLNESGVLSPMSSLAIHNVAPFSQATRCHAYTVNDATRLPLESDNLCLTQHSDTIAVSDRVDTSLSLRPESVLSISSSSAMDYTSLLLSPSGSPRRISVCANNNKAVDSNGIVPLNVTDSLRSSQPPTVDTRLNVVRLNESMVMDVDDVSVPRSLFSVYALVDLPLELTTSMCGYVEEFELAIAEQVWTCLISFCASGCIINYVYLLYYDLFFIRRPYILERKRISFLNNQQHLLLVHCSRFAIIPTACVQPSNWFGEISLPR